MGIFDLWKTAVYVKIYFLLKETEKLCSYLLKDTSVYQVAFANVFDTALGSERIA